MRPTFEGLLPATRCSFSGKTRLANRYPAASRQRNSTRLEELLRLTRLDNRGKNSLGCSSSITARINRKANEGRSCKCLETNFAHVKFAFPFSDLTYKGGWFATLGETYDATELP